MTTLRVFALALVLGGASVDLAVGGGLTPPGVPDETNSQIDARTPIPSPGSPVTYPITITEPGSYRLTRNIELGTMDANAIRIQASHVTLDLCGFALRNPSMAEAAIVIDPSVRSVVIRNGVLEGWNDWGISGDQAQSVHVENMVLRDCFIGGISLGNGAVFDACQVYDTRTRPGLRANGSLIARHSQALSTGGEGIHLNTVGLDATAELIAVIHSCTVRGAGSRGIAADNGLIHGCLVENSANAGIYASAGSFVWGNRIMQSGLNPQTPAEDSGIRGIGTGGRIEGNTIVDSNFGVNFGPTVTSGGAIFGNTTRLVTDPYGEVPSVVMLGPIQAASSTTASPWANFTH